MSSNINLQDYYSKISEMRGKILSKHQNNQTNGPKIAQITFSENINTYVPQTKVQKNNSATTVTPLGEVNDDRRTINCRVRELDDINDKIKNMLAYKRSAQKNSNHLTEKSSSIQKYEKNIVENKLKIPQTTNEYKPRNEGVSYKRDAMSIQRQLSKERTLINQIQKQSYSIVDKIPSKLTESVAQTFRINNNTPSKSPIKQLTQKQEFFNQIPTENTYEYVSKISLKSAQRQKMVKILLKQVQIDRKLGELKQKFEYYNNAQKLRTLYLAFQRLNVRITGSEIQNWIRFHPQQSNPFVPINSCQQFDSNEFAYHIMQAKQHWQKVVKQSISIKNLENQCFTITQIDLQSKGYITIEDIICYLNINSNEPSLRKRDLFSLFKRLKNQQYPVIPQNKLKYETFLNFITK